MGDKESTAKQELTIHKHGDHYHATLVYPYTRKLPAEPESSKRDEKV